MATKYPFTEEQTAQLAECYHNTSSEKLAVRFNCPVRKIYNLAHDLGLKKDMEYIRETSRINMLREDHPAKKFWIKKGTIPANKGKKQVDFMSPEAIERTKKTRFKKGKTTWNVKQVGTERINTYGYTELGHQNTERIHLHGIIFTTKIKDIVKHWKYGNVTIGNKIISQIFFEK